MTDLEHDLRPVTDLRVINVYTVLLAMSLCDRRWSPGEASSALEVPALQTLPPPEECDPLG